MKFDRATSALSLLFGAAASFFLMTVARADEAAIKAVCGRPVSVAVTREADDVSRIKIVLTHVSERERAPSSVSWSRVRADQTVVEMTAPKGSEKEASFRRLEVSVKDAKQWFMRVCIQEETSAIGYRHSAGPNDDEAVAELVNSVASL